MTTLTIHPAQPLAGTTTVPGDKSISHRALILGALASGPNHVQGWLAAGDTLATLGALRALGVDVQRQADRLSFAGGALQPPTAPIDCVNAGTGMRLLAGLLAGQPFPSTLDGSEQLRRRPMRRITEPLRHMGADIADSDGRAPLHIQPAVLRGVTHELAVASAQVKSAILLAGVQTDGLTTVIEPGPSRDHTERMLGAMGADLAVEGLTLTLNGDRARRLEPLDVIIPGDISSAAFVIVAALLVPGSEVTVTSVGLNNTRTGLLDVLADMGAGIAIEDRAEQGGEPVGALHIRASELQATTIGGELVVRAIDELPILALTATQAHGETVIRDAAELRVKEVDRIALVAQELRRLGAHIEETPDGMIIEGSTPLTGALVHSHGDHRLGMALAVAGLIAQGETCLEDAACIDDSFPGFIPTFTRLGAELDA